MLLSWVNYYMGPTRDLDVLAQYNHEGEAAKRKGNSPKVIHRHYKGLLKKADATEFWNLTSTAVESEIVTFKGEATE